MVAEVEPPFPVLIEKSTAEADRVTVCGDPDALSVTCKLPVAGPTAVALSVTVIVHEACTATAVPQLELALKFPAAPEVIAPTFEMESGALPEFVSVMDCWAVAPTRSGKKVT